MRFRRPLDIVVAVYELITIDELGAVSFGLRGQLGGWRIKREIPQLNAPSQSAHPRILNLTLFFFYKNIFYKNIEAEICEILRIF